MIRLKCNYGRQFKAGAEIPVEKIGEAEFERLRGLGLAETVVFATADQIAEPGFVEALKGYLDQLDVNVERLVVVLDLAEAGGDDEAVLFAEAMRSFERGPMVELGHRIDSLMRRARDVTGNDLDRHQAADTLALRFEAMSDGGQGAEAPASAPENTAPPADLADATHTDAAHEASPSSDDAAQASAETAAEATTTDNASSEGAAAGEAAEAPAPVVEPAVVATPEAAPKAHAKTGGRKKSEAV